MTKTNYIPLISTLKNYDKRDFKFDFVAALTVAVIALPQSMAYAMIAGVNPAYGLYAAIVLTIVASAFGSSHHLATGPTNAISLLIASYMAVYLGKGDFFSTLFLLTFMVGFIQLSMGVLKLGSLVNYVSHSVIVGFTAGAGVIIAMGQLSNLLGIKLPQGKLSSVEKVTYCFQHLDKMNMAAVGIGLFTIATILILKKINKNIPGSLLGIVFSVIMVITMGLDKYHLKMAGNIPHAIPPLSMPNFSLTTITDLASGSIVIAIIGLVEALAISKAISSQTRQRIDTNQEFIGQGVANMVGSFLSCIPGSGSFTRSAVTYQSGGKTRLTGVLVGILLLVLLAFLAPFAKFIPNASLAGVIMIVAYSMIDKRAVSKVFRSNKNDAIVLTVTMLTTIFADDLENAIYAGVIVSLLLYLRETGAAGVKLMVPTQAQDGNMIEKVMNEEERKLVNDGVSIIQLQGNLYFGSSSDLNSKLNNKYCDAKVFVIRFMGVTFMDVTALEVVELFIMRAQADNKRVILAGITDKIYGMFEKMHLVELIGKENVFKEEDEAFASFGKVMDKAKSSLRSNDNFADQQAIS